MKSQPNCLEAELNEKLEGAVLPEMCGFHEQCIYIIPQRIKQLNPKAYTPQVVSIGPFHNPFCGSVCEDNNVLKPMEETKLSYFKGFLNRTQLRVADLLPKLKEQESRIRRCYAGGLISSYTSNDFLKMIIIDACFIIEHFLRYYEFSKWDGKDPLLLSNSLSDNIYDDLILLENQLPFFVLEEIYNATHPSFVEITFHYFQRFNLQKKEPLGVCPKHFTDLIRIFLLPPSSSSFDLEQEETRNDFGQVYSASQLSEAGVVFKVSKRKCMLDLNFEKGVLTMPAIPIDDSTEVYLRNILAYEQYHYPHSPHITQYMYFLDDLINTEKDVRILVDKKIIVNFMGDADSVATLVNNLAKHIFLQGFNSKHIYLYQALNGFYENPINKFKAHLMHEYFNTPVKIASTIAAGLLVFLTLLQTIFSVKQ